MTNVVLSILLSTNAPNICKLNVSGVTNTHVYSIQVANYCIPEPSTNWIGGWIFVGSDNGVNSFYDYYTDTNKYYRVQDMGLKF
jgi:hypothetical protein